MKYFIFIVLALTGCATTEHHIVEVPKVVPDPAIMVSCRDFVYPKSDIPDELVLTIAKNKAVYARCSELNEKKKNFINNYIK